MIWIPKVGNLYITNAVIYLCNENSGSFVLPSESIVFILEVEEQYDYSPYYSLKFLSFEQIHFANNFISFENFLREL